MVTQESPQCHVCGHQLPLHGGFCPACGSPRSEKSSKRTSSRRVASSSKRASTSSKRSRSRRPDPYEGMVLDQKYRILEKIGEGGMALIYRAEHVFLREMRAIKVIKRPDHRKETQYGRFLREARLTRKVCALAPHVARVDDFGYDQKKGVYYYSMELLEGKSLRELLREPPYYLSPQRTVRIAVQICEAMSTSHEQGVVHRDLKPDNIFLSNMHGEEEYVKILDYGLAKPLDPDEPNFTDVGKVVGTPEYMSPEQCRGPSPEDRLRGVSHVDGRADVYSLGIILYQCLAGRVPFSLEGEPTPQNFLRLMSRQISEQPKSLRRIRNDLSPALIEVVEKSLRKKSNERYRSMLEMQRALLQAVPDAGATATHHSGAHNTAFDILELAQVVPSLDGLPIHSQQSTTFQLQLDPELEY